MSSTAASWLGAQLGVGKGGVESHEFYSCLMARCATREGEGGAGDKATAEG